jgi:hypothetical protein
LVPVVFLYAQQSQMNSDQSEIAVNGQRLKQIEDNLAKLELWHDVHAEKQEADYIIITNRLTVLEVTVQKHEQLLWMFIGMVLLIITKEILGLALRRGAKIEKIDGRN